ncbi:hypothetical protein [Mycobacterium sp. 1245805.9]|uniref:hypothetical protein n=1 Tax=Mycobacterium sp. 1245805.9 TaxID=1856862 RepID=UPI0007FC73B1|nr:hypothetical protein [Mycobacterium sp. 1245805.9]OBI93935.1 hypothetical protein A9X00_13695 [Mycobacterium sp. 1245805.9]
MQLSTQHARTYALVVIGLVGWELACLYFVLFVYRTDIYSLSYYAANYNFGFVRRGLGGELVRIFPGGDYFTAAYAVMWLPAVAWLIALCLLILTILSKGIRSERRIMLALLVAILPFSLTYAMFSPRPELWGMSALAGLGMALTWTRKTRPRIAFSALYGVAIASLALVHEAIPLEFALGAVLAIIVLAKDATPAVRRICTALAVVPGIVTMLLLAWLGRRDVATQLCAQLPHRMVDDPYVALTSRQKTLDYLLGRVESRSDYHDFECKVISQLDRSVTDAIGSVTRVGFVPLGASFILGVLMFAGSIWAIGYFSGVPVRHFLREAQGRLVLPALALASMALLFVTASDWTRWWVLITFDVAVVYLLYAIDRPQIEQAPSRRTLAAFIAVVVVLAIPTGHTSHVGGPGLPSAPPAAAR